MGRRCPGEGDRRDDDRRHSRLVRLVASALPGVLLAACGGGGDGGDDENSGTGTIDPHAHEGAIVVAGAGGTRGDAVRAAVVVAAERCGIRVTYLGGPNVPNMPKLLVQAE